MNFEFDEVQQSVRDVARSFARSEITPHARAWDAAGQLPNTLLRTLSELGFLGLLASEDVGGAGLDGVAFAVVIDELARGSGAVGFALAAHNAVAAGAESCAPEKSWAAELCRGERVGVFTDAGADRIRQTEAGTAIGVQGETQFRLPFRTQALVAMQFAASSANTAGVCLLPIAAPEEGDARWMDTPLGVRATPALRHRWEGEQGHPVACEHWAIADGWVRLGLAAAQCGIGEGALNAAIAYAKEREQFGRPIASFQAIQWMIADARTELDAARLLTLRAAANPKRGYVAMARQHANAAARHAADCALQIHGGYGYTTEFPVERALRDATCLASILGGTDQPRRAVAADILD